MIEYNKKPVSIYLFFIFLCILNSGCVKENKKYEESRFLFDTIIQMTVYDKDYKKAKIAAEKAFAEMERIDKTINNHSTNGEIYKLNNAEGKKINLSEETILLLKKSLEVGDESAGRYDITIAPLFDIWHFDKNDNRSVPNEKELKEKITFVNYKNIQINGLAATFLTKNGKIEAGSFLKGYAISRAKTVLKNEGINSAFISGVSSIETVGIKPDNTKWRVGLQNPNNPYEYLFVLELGDKALGVAGDYQTYIEVNGKKYHHILDVKTGYPVDGVKMVVIIADNSYEADLYDTAVFACGVKDGLKLMEKHKFSGMIIDSENKRYYTGDFEKYISKGKK